MKQKVKKEIEGYENYEVTTTGEIISTKRGKVMKPRINNHGYLQINLCKNGKKKGFLIHRLVAESFIPNPDNLPEVNHRDEDKTNNCVDNLEWCTHEYNINYGTGIERMAKAKTNGNGCKTVLQLRKDGSLVRIWPSTMEIKRQLNYGTGCISKCCLGKRHTAHGYKWCYVKQ